MTKTALPPLTRAESEIMNVLWSRDWATVHDVVEATGGRAAYTTVLTILRILEKKGHVLHRAAAGGGRAFQYGPAVSAQKVKRRHVQDFVGRFFHGEPAELVAGLVTEEKLTRVELESLRALIDARLEAVDKKEAGR
jgi:BlaI family penicillinase repressor